MPERTSQIALTQLARALEADGVQVADVPVRARERVRVPAFGPGLRLAWLRLRGYRILHLHWIPFSNQRLLRTFLRVLSLLGIRLVWSVHNVLPHEPHAQDVENLRLVYKHARVRIVHTEASRARLREEFGLSATTFHIPLGNLNDVYPPGPPRDAARQKLGISADKFVLLLFGHLRPYKGVDDFLSVVESLPKNFVGLVVGKPHPSIRPVLEEAAHRLGDRVKLVGDFVPDAEVASYFNACDAVLYPFKAITGTHSVFLAYAFRRPALVRSLPGMDEVVRDGQTGFLCQTVTDFADRVQALARDPARARRIAEAAHDWAARQFPWTRVAEGTRLAYETSLEHSMPVEDRLEPPKGS